MASFAAELLGDSIHNAAVPTHFMWLQSVERRVSIYFENLLLAVTTDALRVIEVGRDVYEPVLYLPKQDICAELRPNGITTRCPLKGDASYHDLLDATGRVAAADAAWAYQTPIDIAKPLAGRVAFDRARFAVEIGPI